MSIGPALSAAPKRRERDFHPSLAGISRHRRPFFPCRQADFPRSIKDRRWFQWIAPALPGVLGEV
jgi:hypothetical protein